MNRVSKAARGLSLCAAVVLGACSDFVTVDNPNVVDGDAISPETDGPMLAWSAFQDFVAGYGDIALYTAWFTTEAYTGDSSEDRSEIGRRSIDAGNPRLNSDVWVRFSRGLSTSENAIDVLENASDASRNVHLARVNLSAGYSYLLMAETFCQGVERGGPALTTAQMLERAAERFTSAREIAQAAGTTGAAIANAATVGLARTRLQQGRNADAVQLAQQVPANFSFPLYTLDDPANRERLGNRLWDATAARAALVVPPAYRARANEGDPRIQFVDMGVTAYDGFLRMYAQRKYPSWAAAYTLADGLEARYIAIEAAGDEGAMRAFVNQRRAVGNQSPLDASVSGAALLTEFLAQKSVDFWLEGKRMGDFRRHGTALPGLIPSGAEFYKPAAGPVGNDVCFPLPIAETSANPNF